MKALMIAQEGDDRWLGIPLAQTALPPDALGIIVDEAEEIIWKVTVVSAVAHGDWEFVEVPLPMRVPIDTFRLRDLTSPNLP